MIREMPVGVEHRVDLTPQPRGLNLHIHIFTTPIPQIKLSLFKSSSLQIQLAVHIVSEVLFNTSQVLSFLGLGASTQWDKGLQTQASSVLVILCE